MKYTAHGTHDTREGTQIIMDHIAHRTWDIRDGTMWDMGHRGVHSTCDMGHQEGYHMGHRT